MASYNLPSLLAEQLSKELDSKIKSPNAQGTKNDHRINRNAVFQNLEKEWVENDIATVPKGICNASRTLQEGNQGNNIKGNAVQTATENLACLENDKFPLEASPEQSNQSNGTIYHVSKFAKDNAGWSKSAKPLEPNDFSRMLNTIYRTNEKEEILHDGSKRNPSDEISNLIQSPAKSNAAKVESSRVTIPSLATSWSIWPKLNIIEDKEILKPLLGGRQTESKVHETLAMQRNVFSSMKPDTFQLALNLSGTLQGELIRVLPNTVELATNASFQSKSLMSIGHVVVMAISTLIAGLLMIPNIIRDLGTYHIEHFRATIGHNVCFNGIIAVVSYLVFGSIGPVAYAFSYRITDDYINKYLVTSGVSLTAVLALSFAKARVSGKAVVSTVFFYLVTGIWASVLGFLGGLYGLTLLEQFGLVN